MPLEGLNDHGEQSVFRHHHLAGAAPPSLDEEFYGQSFPDEYLQIFCEDLPVQGVATKTPPQKESPGLAEEITERAECHIGAGGDQGQLNAMLVKDIR